MGRKMSRRGNRRLTRDFKYANGNRSVDVRPIQPSPPAGNNDPEAVLGQSLRKSQRPLTSSSHHAPLVHLARVTKAEAVGPSSQSVRRWVNAQQSKLTTRALTKSDEDDCTGDGTHQSKTRMQATPAQKGQSQGNPPCDEALSPRTRGQKRRAADALEGEPTNKAAKKLQADDVSSAHRVLRVNNRGSRALRNLDVQAGHMIRVREVSHQLDNRPAPDFEPDQAEKMTYFTINGEKFCSKWRMQIITKVMPEGVRCVSLYTHNGQGLRNKTVSQKKAYVSVRDSRRFPTDDTSTIFHVEGISQPLLTEEMYGTWKLEERTTARLEYKEFDKCKVGFKVGKLTKPSLKKLQELLNQYPEG